MNFTVSCTVCGHIADESRTGDCRSCGYCAREARARRPEVVDDRPGFRGCSEPRHAFGCPCRAGGDIDWTCDEPLLDRDGYRARCTVRRYTEHSHHDHTARAAVAAGLAAEDVADAERRQARDLDR